MMLCQLLAFLCASCTKQQAVHPAMEGGGGRGGRGKKSTRSLVTRSYLSKVQGAYWISEVTYGSRVHLHNKRFRARISLSPPASAPAAYPRVAFHPSIPLRLHKARIDTMATEECAYMPSSAISPRLMILCPRSTMQATPEPVAQDTPMPTSTSEPNAGAGEENKTKKRPRIDMAVEPRERKRGKTMFGLVLGTLAKAKNEDKERNASEAVRRLSRLSPVLVVD